MIIGGIKHREQKFNSRSAGVSSALLFISVGGTCFIIDFSFVIEDLKHAAVQLQERSGFHFHSATIVWVKFAVY